jgi:hypothetical protein
MRLDGQSRNYAAAGLAAMVGLAGAGAVIAANCTVTTVNRIPIQDLGTGLYLNQFQGGLYPGGLNQVPEAHAAAGAKRAAEIVPRNTQGAVDLANGRYVLLSIGMSNTTQEYSRFMQFASTSPDVNHSKLVIVDGAAGGQTASTWDQPTDQNYNRVRDEELAPWGLTEAQVQAAWVKVANAGPSVSLPNPNAEAYVLQQQMGNIARALKVRYPNIKVVFVSSRIYAGYATGVSTLNPEPYAYEYGFAVKWLIEAQINQMNGGGIDPLAGDLDYTAIAPWLAWGPYIWADGTNPSSDGLHWECSDFANDGTHPSDSGRTKVANRLMQFMLNSPFAEPWFRGRVGDATGDGAVNVLDLLAVIQNWGPCPVPCPARCAADVAPIAGNCVVNVQDLLTVINNWDA